MRTMIVLLAVLALPAEAADFRAPILRVATNGPFAYALTKDGVGLKANISLAGPNAALNEIRDAIAANLDGETVNGARLMVRASTDSTVLVLRADIRRVTTGGPFTYLIIRNGIAFKIVGGVATLAAAFNGARDDIAAEVGGATVTSGEVVVQSGP